MRTSLEVADVFRDGASRFEQQYGYMLSREQRQVCRAVVRCRTAALGGHAQRCADCGHERIQYNSCRNRHCPKCQALARAAWLQQRESELLPIPYFHLVFTLPREVGPLALQNKRVVYGILFRAAAETLRQLAAEPKHLGAEIGALMVLHTWGQNLMHHPHVHAVVSGGGVSADGSRWVPCKKSKKSRKHFFIHVRVLSAVFRGKFLDLLGQAFATGQLSFHGQLQPLSQTTQFHRLLKAAVSQSWVVYAKRPFSSPQRVLKYLARYTHRVAISNQRLVGLKDGQVRFRYKDYAAGQQIKVMRLSTEEFTRRFLMHTLPTGFVRIRYYGFLSNRFRQERLRQCRQLLGDIQTAEDRTEAQRPSVEADQANETERCPVCKLGRLIVTHLVKPDRPLLPRRPHSLRKRVECPAYYDSS